MGVSCLVFPGVLGRGHVGTWTRLTSTHQFFCFALCFLMIRVDRAGVEKIRELPVFSHGKTEVTVWSSPEAKLWPRLLRKCCWTSYGGTRRRHVNCDVSLDHPTKTVCPGFPHHS